MGYSTLSEVYDALMTDVDYTLWADYLDGLLKKFQCPGTRLADLGCGTGNITIPLALKGYRMTGVDLSGEMLAIAEEKGKALGLTGVEWMQGDILEAELDWEAYDGVIATFDVLNHLIDETDVQMLFQQLSFVLKDNGLLIFDIQTPYRLQQVQGNNIHVYHGDEIEYVWENHFDEETQICYMDLTFFLKREDGLYEKKTEHQEERSYDPELLALWLELSGFEVLALYNELTEDSPKAEDLRTLVVARRKPFETDWSEEDEDSVF